jgi:hypothetical protein
MKCTDKSHTTVYRVDEHDECLKVVTTSTSVVPMKRLKSGITSHHKKCCVHEVRHTIRLVSTTGTDIALAVNSDL